MEPRHLRLKHKKRKWQSAKRAPRDLSKLSIEERPDLSSRAEFGHWEGDTVELIRGRSYIVTMVERSTRFLVVALVPNKKAETVRNAILSMFRHFPQAVKKGTILQGTFCKKFPETLKNFSYFLQLRCKIIEVFEGLRELFEKTSLKNGSLFHGLRKVPEHR